MKCQECGRNAPLHITEVIKKDEPQTFHFCEECAQKFLNEKPLGFMAGEPTAEELAASDDESELNAHTCENCGIQFVDFRNSGRLGCPHDYTAFRTELLPLLESIHGSARHAGKAPRHTRPNALTVQELGKLRRLLTIAIELEHYEEAAHLRDRIRELENRSENRTGP
jgi:protein arginine kinase activator